MIAETAPAVHPWLVQFPTTSLPHVVAWFKVASQHAATPEALLALVGHICRRKGEADLSYATAYLCEGVERALRYGRQGALSYAATLLAVGTTK